MRKTKPHTGYYTIRIFAVAYAVACGAAAYQLATEQHIVIVVALFLGPCIAAAFAAAALDLRNNDRAGRTPGRH